MSQPVEQTPKAKSPLSIPNFRNLWIGQTISQIGDGLTNLAVLIVINSLTGSTAAVATMTIAIALPQLLFGLLAGVFVDRWDRKRIMIVSDVLRGVMVLGFILVRRPEDVWFFYVIGFLQAAVGTFFDPAKSALMPAIVERDSLLSANALSQTTRVITGVIGFALAGVLVGAFGNAWPAFSLDALTFFVSALFIARISAPHQAPVAAKNSSAREVFVDLKDGLQYLFGQQLLAGAVMTFAVTMLGLGAVNVLFVPFLVNLLEVRTEALGIVEAAQVAGMIVGSGLVAALAARLKPALIIVVGVGLVGLLIAFIGAAVTLWMVLVGLFFVGLFITPVQAAASTLLQAHVSADKRGRVSSVMNTVITLASVISMALAGVLGDTIGVRQVFYLAGLVAIVAAFVAAALMREPTATRSTARPTAPSAQADS
jgi:MFS family permease